MHPPLSPQPAHKTQFAAICARTPHNALIAAECAHLTGSVPDADGFALCQSVEHIPQAAYLRTGLHILAQGATPEELLQAVSQANFAADEFRVEFLSLALEKRIAPQQTTLALANAIPSYPNLKQPKHRFLLVERDNGLWFGEVVAECGHTYQSHDAKPHRTSTSLPSRISRALVNLVVPGAGSVLDPCCGTGSILLEAQALGVTVFGADQNPVIVGMARENLAHFGYFGLVEPADIRDYHRPADALVTDLPYGRLLAAEETAVRTIIEHGRRLAPVAVYVAEHDLTDWLAAAGYGEISVYPVFKRDNFARYVHLAMG